ncbi:MAG TPA: ATP-binding cassette domain-containing protein [Chloroflexota bacterium]|nr:ATP-binding cassette domain-containing protein [Chloroflexota bacterium]
MSGVCKTFRQRQRSEQLTDVLRNLLKPTYREVHALQAIDLAIRRGEIVAYAGANGAGKSTTIKLLSGMLWPDAGRICVLGMDPARERTRYVGRIGVVFGQRTELWNDHPIAASFEWKRVVWDIPRDRYDRMLGAVKEMLGLHEFFQTMARELSLGQRMRADLGLALLHEPEVLFLDEPTLGMDVLARRNMLRFIKEINRKNRVTVMVTSHDMSELEQLAGRIVMISHGRIAYDGDFDRLRREFVDRRTLQIETGRDAAPTLEDALWVSSEAGRHTYQFDAACTGVAALLAQATAQGPVLDVETQRAPIDDVIADIYERWQREKALAGLSSVRGE